MASHVTNPYLFLVGHNVDGTYTTPMSQFTHTPLKSLHLKLLLPQLLLPYTPSVHSIHFPLDTYLCEHTSFFFFFYAIVVGPSCNNTVKRVIFASCNSSRFSRIGHESRNFVTAPTYAIKTCVAPPTPRGLKMLLFRYCKRVAS